METVWKEIEYDFLIDRIDPPELPYYGRFLVDHKDFVDILTYHGVDPMAECLDCDLPLE